MNNISTPDRMLRALLGLVLLQLAQDLLPAFLDELPLLTGIVAPHLLIQPVELGGLVLITAWAALAVAAAAVSARIVRVAPGSDPTYTALTEVYEPPFPGYGPRGGDIDRNGV